MRVRAIKDLMQLGEPAFFAAISEGLELIVQNVSRLHDSALTLAKASQPHAARVLVTLAEEEAAKVLILLDAVRSRPPTGSRASLRGSTIIWQRASMHVSAGCDRRRLRNSRSTSTTIGRSSTSTVQTTCGAGGS